MIIKNARVFDGVKFLREDTVEAKRGIITGIYKGAPPRIKTGIIDAEGMILSPGLIDIHTHGAGGVHTLDIKSKKDIRKISMENARAGVTAVLAACFYSPETAHIIEKISQYAETGTGAFIAGVYLEGPFISSEKRGMIPAEFIVSERERADEFLKFAANKNNKIKICCIAPEHKVFSKAAVFLKEQGIIMSMGHSSADYKETLRGIKKGISCAAHLFNAMKGLHHREPGPAAAFFEEKNTFVEVIADGVHIHRSVLRIIYKLFGRGRIVLITDSPGLKEGGGKKRINAAVRAYRGKNGAYYLDDGRLMGGGASLLQAVKNMREWCGIPLQDALAMATSTPAAVSGIKAGRIKKSLPADMILLDEKLNLKKVFVRGKQFKT
ncbi:MAG: N-acetylglucosamine-6-phosphate deacetylase [Candidatus Goldiibacteriota bacterium]